MHLSWTGLKISIAGAKLSHLVQKDSIWDHGSMIEQVRTVFNHLKKAWLRQDSLMIKKCVTPETYEKISADIQANKRSMATNAELLSIEIISVVPAKHNNPDRFTALIKMEKEHEAAIEERLSFYETNRLVEEEWLFLRDGNWWLLHKIKK
jgi:predicted lipid-binding transport protein (Tim44 family)